MPKFKYRALSKTGEINEQKDYEAESEQDLRSMLLSNGLSPLSIEELSTSKEINFNFTSKIKTKDLAIFCRQFATMIEAGVTINYSIDMLATQVSNKKLRSALSEISEDIKKGKALSEAMASIDGYFPPLLISMVEVGEMSGTLDSILNRMAEYYEKETKMNGKIRNAMIYPVILATVTIFVMCFILMYVMPMFIDMFASEGVELPVATKITLALGGFLSSYWYIVLVIAIIMGIGFFYYTQKTENGQYIYNKYKLKRALMKELHQKIVVSRFTRALSTVLGSGISINQSLDVVGGVLGNKFADIQVKKVKERVLKGEGLADPIRDTGVFPLMLSSMIKIGEESGSLDGILEKTADFYDAELERTIEALTTIIEPIMLVVMGIIVGFLIISILLPMFQMYEVMGG